MAVALALVALDILVASTTTPVTSVTVRALTGDVAMGATPEASAATATTTTASLIVLVGAVTGQMSNLVAGEALAAVLLVINLAVTVPGNVALLPAAVTGAHGWLLAVALHMASLAAVVAGTSSTTAVAAAISSPTLTLTAATAATTTTTIRSAFSGKVTGTATLVTGITSTHGSAVFCTFGKR